MRCVVDDAEWGRVRRLDRPMYRCHLSGGEETTKMQLKRGRDGVRTLCNGQGQNRAEVIRRGPDLP